MRGGKARESRSVHTEERAEICTRQGEERKPMNKSKKKPNETREE